MWPDRYTLADVSSVSVWLVELLYEPLDQAGHISLLLLLLSLCTWHDQMVGEIAHYFTANLTPMPYSYITLVIEYKENNYDNTSLILFEMAVHT